MQVCIVCQKEFEKKKSTTGKYCGLDCWYKYYEIHGKTGLKSCPICQKEFHGRKICCSVECKGKYQKLNNPNRNKQCKICNKSMEYCKPGRIYCSTSCSNTDRIRQGQYSRPELAVANAGGGYKKIKVGSKWMLEHRYIMEQKLGRQLEPHERVHHLNGDRADNRPENLELWKVKAKDPAGVRASDYHCPGCNCGELNTNVNQIW